MQNTYSVSEAAAQGKGADACLLRSQLEGFEVTRVDQTKAGKSIAAWVVLKRGKMVAKVQAHYADSGRLTVNVFDFASDIQTGYASGWGYDKLPAALSGLVIDGVQLYDHCEPFEPAKRFLKRYIASGATWATSAPWSAKAKRLGMQFANYNREHDRYDSCYVLPGLERLSAMGYDVLQAI